MSQIEVDLTNFDCDINAFRHRTLEDPSIRVVGAFANGQRLSEDSFRHSPKLGAVFWTTGGRRPTRIRVILDRLAPQTDAEPSSRRIIYMLLVAIVAVAGLLLKAL